MQRYLEEVEKELEQNQQKDAHVNFVGRRKALKKGEFPSLCDQGCVCVCVKIFRTLGLKYVYGFL